MDAVTRVPVPVNEPVRMYAPGSAERTRLEHRLKELAGEQVELTMTIGGEERMGGGEPFEVVQPHAHASVIGTARHATPADAQDAIDAALAVAADWQAMSFDDRAAIFLRAADLLTGSWRDTINASTMLGQSKTVHQAEIDAVCELADFWRFNIHFARHLLEEQPLVSPAGMWNRTDHRPLEGFVYAISPFNFTSIAANLPTAPALMGNVVLWKPSITQQHSAHFTMRLLEEAGLPPGVINMVTGHGLPISEVALPHPDLAGIHLTGSTATFQRLWREVGDNIERYRTYPRLVGETGGKDFIVAHPSADPEVLRVAMTRGAFEYQGQKCSAASRAYVPRSIWKQMRDEFVAEVESIEVGDISDLRNFMGAVIDERAFAKHAAAIERAKADATVEVIAGGMVDDSSGWFVRPTVVESSDPENEVFTTEYFGPILGVHVYADREYERMLVQMESAAPYGLTGAIIARDRSAIADATEFLRFAAGNFYINDKPTGAVVGQQPFGGARASGTNDKAGSPLNLLRWVSPRSIKETFDPPTDYRYPFMG